MSGSFFIVPACVVLTLSFFFLPPLRFDLFFFLLGSYPILLSLFLIGCSSSAPPSSFPQYFPIEHRGSASHGFFLFLSLSCFYVPALSLHIPVYYMYTAPSTFNLSHLYPSSGKNRCSSTPWFLSVFNLHLFSYCILFYLWFLDLSSLVLSEELAVPRNAVKAIPEAFALCKCVKRQSELSR